MNIFEEYAKTKSLIAGLTDKLKEIEPKLLEEVSSAREAIKNEYGTFTKQTRTNYKFTKELVDWISSKKKEIEKRQAEEIATGKVEVSETVSVRFIAPKK